MITAGSSDSERCCSTLGTQWARCLQASLYWEPGEPIFVNLCPDMDASAWLLKLKRSKKPAIAALKQVLPARLATTFRAVYCAQRVVRSARCQISNLASCRLSRWAIYPTGTQGYKKAEVTRGGVAVSCRQDHGR